MSPTESDLCLVLMPFGPKANPFPGPKEIDFDTVYRNLIVPAIKKAGLQPFRADQEIASGMIDRPLFERLLLCKYAVADLTAANPNVYYELGIRHAVRPWSTVLVYGSTARLPFDVSHLRAIPYSITNDGFLSNVDQGIQELRSLLLSMQDAASREMDSPVFTLLREVGYRGPDLTRLHLDMGPTIKKCCDFRKAIDQVEPGHAGIATLRIIENRISQNSGHDSALLELLTAYRKREAWDEMISLIEKMPDSLRNTVCVQEQYGMALGRKRDFSRAETVLTDLIEKRGPSALTYAFLGVVQKKRFLVATEDGDDLEALGARSKALDAFLTGFKLDPRMIFTGINAALLLEASDEEEKKSELRVLLPVVRYFIDDAVSSRTAGFWEHSAELELAVLDNDKERAFRALGLMLVDNKEPWMPFSTCTNLQMIHAARVKRGVDQPWYIEIVRRLEAQSISSPPDNQASKAATPSGSL